MAEDSDQERTEEPTGKKLEDARQKGQIARSKEIGTTVVLMTSAIALLMYGDDLAKALMTIFKRLFSLNRDEAFDTTKMFSVWVEVASTVLWPMSMIFIMILIAAFIGNILLGGYNLAWDAALPKFSKMSPMKGFKRMFGTQALVELVKALLKFLLIASMAAGLIWSYFKEILHLSQESVPNSIVHSVTILAWMFLALASILIIIAVIDGPFQKYNHIKQLRMTKQEIKDEYKNQEGDPQVKGRIRRAQREISQRRMMAEVPNADVIVTNPTHYAVALKYDTEKAGAPYVIASGIDEIAQHIRTIAKENGVPIVESPMLARALYHTTEINQQIPDQLFIAVAQVLAYVFQLKQYQKGKAKRPKPLSKKLPIPKEFIY